MIAGFPTSIYVEETPSERHEGRADMRVDELAPAPGATKAPQRVGRGIGGKGGKTAGRGTKGQHSAVAARSPAASKAARCRSSSACRS